MTRNMATLVLAAISMLTLGSVAYAEQPGGTADEAKAMLTKAIAAVKADKAKALEMFNKGQNGFLDREVAGGILRIKGVAQHGVRAGNWLTPEETSALLRAPDPNALKGLRDRAILALLVGCALRRTELARLRVEHLVLRDARWVLVDLVGKGKRVRTVPVPAWTKMLVDDWTARAGITEGRVFRAVNKGGRMWGEQIADDVVWAISREYGAKIGKARLAPHDLRRTCAKLCRASGGALEQIQFLLGHSSVQTTERYLGTRQNLAQAVNDNLPIEVPGSRADELGRKTSDIPGTIRTGRAHS